MKHILGKILVIFGECSTCIILVIWSLFTQSHQFLKVWDDPVIAACSIYTGAVSYTHLDVYKRQGADGIYHWDNFFVIMFMSPWEVLE